ncbi:FadR/GntR family transcriptional regulator [Paracoccus sp. (in: a-proteobacteria)]|uniref:FadR/GntR family transcriptional regulator n=1 Tax=Paracoccus sp. TaxID=267 RepID=UPI00396C5DDF
MTQTIARRLQEMIRSGELKAGQKLPSQRLLAGQLNVSRPSLREALLTLETLGLVQTLPARGTFVLDPASRSHSTTWRYDDAYDLREVFQTRLLLEGQLCRLAATAMTPHTTEALRDAAQAFEEAWSAGDLLAHVEADLALHLAIAAACPNRMLSGLYRTVQQLLTETQRQPIPNTDPDRMSQSIAEHRAIIEALERRDPDGSEARMQDHIRNTARCAGVDV